MGGNFLIFVYADAMAPARFPYIRCAGQKGWVSRSHVKRHRTTQARRQRPGGAERGPEKEFGRFSMRLVDSIGEFGPKSGSSGAYAVGAVRAKNRKIEDIAFRALGMAVGCRQRPGGA